MNYRNIIRRIHKDEQCFGWHHLEGLLEASLPRSESGVDLDCFLDSYVWSQGREPHAHPWVGIVHATESGHSLTIGRTMSDPAVVRSLASCVCLVTLSKVSKECLEKITKVPVFNTHLPRRTTLFFDIDAYFEKPTVRHSGFHARNIGIFEQFACSPKKVLPWRGPIDKKEGIEYESEFKDNLNYMKDVTTSVGFCYLNGAAAHNSVVEHIVSHTPLVVNRMPSVEEYIGSDYPMYYEDIKDRPDDFLLSRDFLQETSSYLKERSKMAMFSEKNFVDFFCNLFIKHQVTI